MNKRAMLLGVMVLGLAGMLTLVAWADDGDGDELSIEQVPEPARAALLKLAAGAKILKAEREREHGVVLYEAEWQVNGVTHEAVVTEDGALVASEETVAPETVPAAVRATMAKHFGPDAKVVVTKKMIVVYELEVKINGQEKELLVFPTGRAHQDRDAEKHHGHDKKGDDDHDDDDDDHDD